jgi:MtN3 and saliva related transmembrane protein
MSIGCFAFVCQGWMLGREGIFLLATNLITFTCSVIIFVIKLQNDSKKKR